MKDRRPIAPVVVASVLGAALWFAAALSGKREAWDASAYWEFAYPITLVACAYLGYAYPHRPWRWVLALFAGQFVAMCIRNGELGNLWPLGMLLFAVIALPGIVAARLGTRLSRRSD